MKISELIIWFLIFVPALALIPASMVKGRGRSFVAWWIYATLLFPIAFIHALMLFAFEPTKGCPYCRAPVPAGAAHCTRCGYEFVDLS